MKGLQSLVNFHVGVKFINPALGDDIHEDVVLVGLGGLAEDKSQVQDAVDRLRSKSSDLSVIYARVLDNALEDLGYEAR